MKALPVSVARVFASLLLAGVLTGQAAGRVVAPPSALAATCASVTPQFTGSNDVSESSELRGVQSTIGYDANHLTIDCSANFYWVGMHGPFRSNYTYCNGAFAQDGWTAQPGSSGFVAHVFTYYQVAADVSNCGPAPILWSQVTQGQTYAVETIPQAQSGCPDGGDVAFYVNNSAITDACVDWLNGNYETAISERQGSTNHIGAVSYTSTLYCTASSSQTSCTPATVYQPNFNNLQSQNIDPYGFWVTLNPSTNFKTCDNRDFLSTSACQAG